MRIITRRRIYRAFPELDHLSEFQCRQLMRRINLSVWRLLIVLAAALIVLCFSCSISSIVFTVVGSLMDELLGGFWDHRGREWIAMTSWAVVGATSFVTPLILALIARDLVLGFFLKRGMRVFLSHTTCPGCKYQLIGQTVDRAGGLRCPECGRPTTLTELGLDTPEDLVPEASTDSVG